MNHFPALRVGRQLQVLSRPLRSVTIPSRVPVHPVRMASNIPVPQPQFAEGEDPQQLSSDTTALQAQGWALDAEGMGVTKTYSFKSYFKAVSFVNFIAAESSAKKHHPTMTVRFGSVDVHWTTHRPRGLTHKDITLARHCDQGAELMGAVEAGQGLKCGPSETKS